VSQGIAYKMRDSAWKLALLPWWRLVALVFGRRENYHKSIASVQDVDFIVETEVVDSAGNFISDGSRLGGPPGPGGGTGLAAAVAGMASAPGARNGSTVTAFPAIPMAQLAMLQSSSGPNPNQARGTPPHPNRVSFK
jgi:hypothetical protein